MKHEPKLDQGDRRLLAALQKNADAPQSTLAEAAGVSASQVSRKISRLKEERVLRGIVGLVDGKAWASPARQSSKYACAITRRRMCAPFAIWLRVWTRSRSA